jgi:hypothetical protein
LIDEPDLKQIKKRAAMADRAKAASLVADSSQRLYYNSTVARKDKACLAWYTRLSLEELTGKRFHAKVRGATHMVFLSMLSDRKFDDLSLWIKIFQLAQDRCKKAAHSHEVLNNLNIESQVDTVLDEFYRADNGQLYWTNRVGRPDYNRPCLETNEAGRAGAKKKN